MKVTKISGRSERYDQQKLRRSLLRSGAREEVADQVLQELEAEMYEGIPTKKIYKAAFRLLRRVSSSHAARYNLRNALLALGPAGFYFERFIARIFEAEGFRCRLDMTLTGTCVGHEVDILLMKDGRISMAECKFHNRRETNSDVKVPMYILSRFNDLKAARHEIFGAGDTISGCLIVTNNRFTEDAITFARCSGIDLLSWDFPPGKGLKAKVDALGLYPLTCLTTLSQAEKQQALGAGALGVADLGEQELMALGIGRQRVPRILREINELKHMEP